MTDANGTSQSDMRIFSSTRCQVGEGPIWHPSQNRLFWVDIFGRKLFASDGLEEHVWTFDGMVSAAAITEDDRLLLVLETGLILFDPRTGQDAAFLPVEADRPDTRGNDGRADRHGGFWFSTMDKDAAPGEGRIYRFYRDEIRLLREGLTIPNAICFAPDGLHVYYTDTPDGRIMRQALDPGTGWPVDEPDLFLDFRDAPGGPDGAIVDAEGRIWIAFWGVGEVRGYDDRGRHVGTVGTPTPNASCPAFGGPDLSTLFVTTAAVGLGEGDPQPENAGRVYRFETSFRGIEEPRVRI